jgi:hypothetical protein
MPPGSSPTPIAEPALFPFEPDGGAPTVETWKYVTNIISAENDSEQRIALRVRPAISVAWNVLGMDLGEAGRLAALLYTNTNNRWYVPLWYSRRVATSVAGTVYTLTDMVGTVFEVGKYALVWRHSDQWDAMTVTAVTGTTVTLTGEVSFPHVGAIVVPLAIGSMQAQNQISRTNIASGFGVTFDLDRTNTAIPTEAAPAQLFEGMEVLNIHPSTTGSEDEQWTQSSERSGGELGPVIYRPLGPTPVVAHPKTWVLTSNAEIAGFRGWLAARRGRWRRLWIPTYTDDLSVVAPIASGANSVDIAYFGYGESFFLAPSRQRIAILVPPETVLPFRVTGVSNPSAFVERLALSGSFTQALPQTTRCSFLVLARLTSDDVAIEHFAPGAATVSASFTELPREVTA